MVDSTTAAEPKAIDLTATTNSEASEASNQSRKSNRDQLREAITIFCKQNPEAAATLQSLLRSPNVAPPRRQFQVVGGHNPKTGIALKRQIASRAAHKCAPSLDLASSSDDDTDEGDAEVPEGCCEDMRMERHKIDEMRDFPANCQEAEFY
ncbi:hypothetical protein BDZ45DRAFT_750699 [Acephala macrosclerotiorum]|nr:hypothetical protein BDZ45DRAFT_750699 [Acephala macrosclerotiorum]